jgi:hypothetical protein
VLAQPALDGGVVGFAQCVAHGGAGGIEIHVGHSRQDGLMFQKGLALESTFPEFALQLSFRFARWRLAC